MVLEQYIANNYLRALLIVVLVFVVLKLFVFILEKVVLRATKKTKTDIDDLIVEKSSKPLSILILLFGLRLAINEFSVTPVIDGIITNIIYSFMILVGGYLAYVVIDLLILRMWRKISKKTKTSVDDSLASLIHTLLKSVWIIFVFLYILNLWGVQIGPFLAGLGIGGIAIAFALKESLSNIFGGVSIILDKTVKVGDYLLLDNNIRGQVTRVGLRSTKVTTFDNEFMIIPNSIVANTVIQNLAQPEPKLRIRVPFGVAYGTNIDNVKKLVLKEIKQIDGFIDEPEGKVFFLSMGDSALNFEARFYVKDAKKRRSAIDEANTRIYNSLNKAGIEIPFPQVDVHLNK